MDSQSGDDVGVRPAMIVEGLLLIGVGVLLLRFRERITHFWVRMFGERADDISDSAQTLGPMLVVLFGSALVLQGIFGG